MSDDDATPLTHGDFRQFVQAICRRLNPPKPGDIAEPSSGLGLHSDCIAEDGKRLRLYDLIGGRTGWQADDGPIRFEDRCRAPS